MSCLQGKVHVSVVMYPLPLHVMGGRVSRRVGGRVGGEGRARDNTGIRTGAGGGGGKGGAGGGGGGGRGGRGGGGGG